MTALGPSGGAASPISHYGGKPRLAMSAAAKGEGGGTTGLPTAKGEGGGPGVYVGGMMGVASCYT